LRYQVYQVGKLNEKDLNVTLPQTWLYDLDTEKGKTYALIGSR